MDKVTDKVEVWLRLGNTLGAHTKNYIMDTRGQILHSYQAFRPEV